MKYLAIGVLASLLCASIATEASAYIACNKNGDCWRTAKRIKVPGVSLTFHSEKWWKKNQHNRRYTWHEAESGRDARHGYWDRGEWRTHR